MSDEQQFLWVQWRAPIAGEGAGGYEKKSHLLSLCRTVTSVLQHVAREAHSGPHT